MDYIITYKRRKSIGLKIDHKGQLYITAPYGTKDTVIRTIISDRQSWIENHQKRIKSNSYDEEKIMVLGTEYKKTYAKSLRNFVEIQEATKEITIFHTPNSNPNLVLEKYFIAQSHNYLEKIFAEVKNIFESKKIITNYPVSLRFYKARWGSCSHKAEISLNYSLYHLPENLIKHIIKHEFCHIKYFDHSKEFYALLKECDVLSDFHRAQIEKYQSYVYYFRKES